MTTRKKIIILLLLTPAPAIFTLASSKMLGQGTSVAVYGALLSATASALCSAALLPSNSRPLPSVAILATAFLAGLVCGWSIMVSSDQTSIVSLKLHGLTAVQMAALVVFIVSRRAKNKLSNPERSDKWLRVAWVAGIFAASEMFHLVGCPWHTWISVSVMFVLYASLIDPFLVSKKGS